jgi:hypothetical protein
MEISQATDDLEKCKKCDFKSCTINGLTKHEKKDHTSYGKTSRNKFNPIKMETDSINDNVENRQEIKSLEEFSMMGANENSELIVPEQLDDSGNIQCQNCDQYSEKCNKCFFKSIILEMIDNI